MLADTGGTALATGPSSPAGLHEVASLAELGQARGHRIAIETERLCHITCGGARVCRYVLDDTAANVLSRRA
jgi:hypothetical protein